MACRADKVVNTVELNGFPYQEIFFGKDGQPVDSARRGAAPSLAADPAVTDLLFLCHGWLEDPAGARARFTGITASMAEVGGAPPGLGVLGMFWPSEKFGSAARIAAATAAITADPAARAEFTKSVRAQVTPSPEVDPGDYQGEFFEQDPAAVFDQLAAGNGILHGVQDVLNLATYYEMKDRSGSVGTVGLLPILAATRAAHPALRMHLVGHSFGGRAMAAAVAAGDVLPIASVTLLQAAFTQYGFARKWDGVHDGAFRRGVQGGRVTGPLVVTYSERDQVLHTAYALASRLAGQSNSILGFGGPHDKYAAIGANGAERTPEARWMTMPSMGAPSPLVAGEVCNLNSTAYIVNHFTIGVPEVAQTIIAAMR